MATFTLPDDLTLVTSRGQKYPATLAKWNDAHVAFLVQYAFSVLVQRSSAGEKDDAEKAIAENKKAQQIADGETPSGRGPRGPRLGFSALAEREILTDLLVGLCGLAKGKAAEGAKATDAAWEQVARAIIIAQLVDQGKDPKSIPLKPLIAANLDVIRDSYDEQIQQRAADLENAAKVEAERAAKAKKACLAIGGLKL